MADVTIGRMDTTVRATDAQTLLSPETLEAITKYVVERVKEELERDKRTQDDRRMWGSALQGDHNAMG